MAPTASPTLWRDVEGRGGEGAVENGHQQLSRLVHLVREAEVEERIDAELRREGEHGGGGRGEGGKGGSEANDLGNWRDEREYRYEQQCSRVQVMPHWYASIQSSAALSILSEQPRWRRESMRS